MVCAARCGCIVAQLIEPKPPASQNDAASPTVPTPVMGASTSGYSILKRSISRRSGHMISHSSSPAVGAHSAVDMQDLACDEGRLFEIEGGIDDVLRLAHSAHGLQASEERMRLGRMHRCLDYAW